MSFDIEFLNEFISKYDWNKLKERIDEIEKTLTEGYIDQIESSNLRKEFAFLSDINLIKLELFEIKEIYNKLLSDLLNESNEEMKSLFNDEINSLKDKIAEKIKAFEEIIFPPEKEQNRSAFLEIRAGTGGLEASLFAGNLARMYSMYSLKQGWEASIVSAAETGVGGFREIIIHIEGKKVFEKLRYESGVHRVQRVPDTEASGRVHTSTATVAVLPEAEEVEVNIDQKDLRIDTYRAGGAGGQHVNKTDSAVRITHIPTGTVVACQDERSQHKNKARAMKILQARIYAAEKEKTENKMSQMRKEQVASADRSDKVRTYNYPQNRVSDHQCGLTINRLEYFMEGDMSEIINALMEMSKKERSVSPYFIKYVL